MQFIKSHRNPEFSHMSDLQVLDLYANIKATRNPDTMTDEQLDEIESKLFMLDDELCARGLDLPC